jgi:monoamine oxidase
MGFNAAEFGSRIEAWSDENHPSAVSTLSTMFGKPIAMPLDAVITRWNSDPFARGSYSLMQSVPHRHNAMIWCVT